MAIHQPVNIQPSVVEAGHLKSNKASKGGFLPMQNRNGQGVHSPKPMPVQAAQMGNMKGAGVSVGHNMMNGANEMYGMRSANHQSRPMQHTNPIGGQVKILNRKIVAFMF